MFDFDRLRAHTLEFAMTDYNNWGKIYPANRLGKSNFEIYI